MLSVLFEALEKAGQVLRSNFGKVQISYKGKANIVTQADLESQKVILNVIRKRLPSHDYRAEESGVKETGSDFFWVIDPLDGTTNYAHGYPAACVSIGLLHRGKPMLGGIYDPFRDECFTAEAGCGARKNAKPIHVSTPKRLKEALLITGFPYDLDKRSHFYIEFYRAFMVS